MRISDVWAWFQCPQGCSGMRAMCVHWKYHTCENHKDPVEMTQVNGTWTRVRRPRQQRSGPTMDGYGA